MLAPARVAPMAARERYPFVNGLAVLGGTARTEKQDAEAKALLAEAEAIEEGRGNGPSLQTGPALSIAA